VADPTPSPRALGAAVRAHRHAKGMTLEDLADASGINVTYVSDIERGRSNPTIGKLSDLASVFEIRISVLLAEAEELPQE
jgi:transcriptional regulator with XRE-family HTH domain